MNYNLSGLFTDFYSLTMMQGYHSAKRNYHVVCDMFFRNAPQGGYIVFSGLEPLLDIMSGLHFSKDDIAFLQTTGQFNQDFLHYLQTFRFSGIIYAVPEGTVCFPNEPLIRVHAPVAEAQLIEGLLLNSINYSSYISTKAARVLHAAKGKKILEMGLRRAPGPNGALLASRAAYIGGASATSNVAAAKEFSIPYVGTMSHSWIMNFENEEQAFHHYAKIYPKTSVFLLDTYNTLNSGLPAAIKVGKKLQKRGYTFGVRLDSGDIDYLSHAVRKKLDKVGLQSTFIIASNNLDENIISMLTAHNCPIDSWGVGTKLVSAISGDELSGVYKLSAKETLSDISQDPLNAKKTQKNVSTATQNNRPTRSAVIPLLKISNNIEKTSLPGIKQIYRCYQRNKHNHTYLADVIVNESHTSTHIVTKHTNTAHQDFSRQIVYHPYINHRTFQLPDNMKAFPMLSCVFSNGVKKEETSIETIKQRVHNNFDCLDYSYRRLLNPHLYKVSINKELKNLRDSLIEKKEKNYKEL